MAIEFNLITTSGATLIEVIQDGVTDGAERSTENTVNLDANGSFTVQTFQTRTSQPKRWVFILEDVTPNATIIAGVDDVDNDTLKAKLYEIFFLDETASIGGSATEAKQDAQILQLGSGANPSTGGGLWGWLIDIYNRLGNRSQKTQLTNGVTDATFTGTALDVQVGNAFALDTNLTDVGTKIGATNSTPAANPSTVTGLSGILRGFWTAIVALFPTSLTASGNFKVAIQEGSVTANIQNNLIDAAGRLKVSVPNPQVSIKYRYDKLPLLVDEKGTGTATFDNPNSCVTMSVTAGQYLVRQTFKKGNYVSGIGLVSDFTMSGFQVEANVTKRIGYFSSSIVAPYDSNFDGISLFNDGTTIRLQVHRSGTLVHNVSQAAWTDPLDGTGESGVTVDWSKIQLCAIDFIWLSAGSVRFWMYFGGKFWLVHQMDNVNSETFAWITSPNQPIRYEIRSTTGVGSMNQICASIYDEGGGEKVSGGTGQPFAVVSGIANVTAGTAGTTYAMLGVRLASDRLDANVLITALSGMNTSNNYGRISLIRNPTVAGTFTYSALTNTPIERAIGVAANTVTGGFVVDSWPFERALGTIINNNVSGLLGSGIDGTAEQYVLCVTPNTNNLTWFAQMNLIELI